MKLLGAGFRVATDQDDDIVLSEDDDAIDELVEVTGCGREAAREALERSCDWTASGRPSRVKAANWLLQSSSSDDGVECVGHTTPGGTR